MVAVPALADEGNNDGASPEFMQDATKALEVSQEFCKVFPAGELMLRSDSFRVELECGNEESAGDLIAAKDIVNGFCAWYRDGYIAIEDKYLEIVARCSDWNGENGRAFNKAMNTVATFCADGTVEEINLGLDPFRIEVQCGDNSARGEADGA